MARSQTLKARMPLAHRCAALPLVGLVRPGLARRWGSAGLILTAFLLTACASPPPASVEARAHFPLLRGWADGLELTYVTTDVSDAAVAKDKFANFVPSLAHAIPAQPGHRSLVDKVYSVTNFAQGSVFASSPGPVGHLNRDRSYTPLWQMVTVTWRVGQAARVLKSQEQVLDAAEKGLVALETTPVVLNCPIIHHDTQGSLPGVSLDRTVR